MSFHFPTGGSISAKTAGIFAKNCLRCLHSKSDAPRNRGGACGDMSSMDVKNAVEPGFLTLTELSVLLQSNALKQALRPYCLGGPYGRLLDAEDERLGTTDAQAFETEGLIGRGAAPAVLSYLFHRIETRLDGLLCGIFGMT
jgi:hypothetical protein